MQSKEERIAVLRSQLENITVNYTPREGSGGGTPLGMEDLVIRLIELEAEAQAARVEYEEAKAEAEALIGKLADPVQRTVLYLRYIDGLSWAGIERETLYGFDALRKVQKRSLEMLQNC